MNTVSAANIALVHTPAASGVGEMTRRRGPPNKGGKTYEAPRRGHPHKRLLCSFTIRHGTADPYVAIAQRLTDETLASYDPAGLDPQVQGL